MTKRNGVALLAGLLFALGLALSGMTQPSKVIGFLDVSGHWDPSLAFVMLGAISVHFVALRVAKKRAAPLLAPTFELPARDHIDGKLVAGAALFGLGWGLSGYCPGPALVSVACGALPPITLCASMLAGMGLHEAWLALRSEQRAEPVCGSADPA